MRRTNLPGHALRSEGKPYVPGAFGEDLWVRPWGHQGVGVALCECGATSTELASGAARKRWHRDVHKPEVRALAGPILAVDVDGVLNAVSRGTVPPKGWEDHRILGFRVRLNPSHGAALLALAAEHGAELTWCTTWEHYANEHIGPLVGLPELPVVPMNADWRDIASVGSSKAAAMRAYAGDRPFCWLDDEPDAARSLADLTVPHKVIRVDSRGGLQDHHLRKAAAWLAGLRTTKTGSKES